MKAVVAAFNQEKALVGAFSVITNLRMDLFQALIIIHGDSGGFLPFCNSDLFQHVHYNTRCTRKIMICLVYVRANDEAWNMCNMKNIYLSMSQFYSCPEIIPVFEWSVFMPKSPLYLKPGSKNVEIVADIAVIMTRPPPKHLFENIVCLGLGPRSRSNKSSRTLFQRRSLILLSSQSILTSTLQYLLQL